MRLWNKTRIKQAALEASVIIMMILMVAMALMA